MQEFLDGAENPQILVKEMNFDDVKRLVELFPKLLPYEYQHYLLENEQNLREKQLLKVATLVKDKKDSMSLNKISKLKLYYDEVNKRVLKVFNI